MRSPSPSPREPVDLLGIGVGPFNLSLAALAGPVADLTAVFLERAGEFRWHPGLMIDGTTLQVPFLADLVSLVDPTSPWSFLNYLRVVERLFPFYFAESTHIDRVEYDEYCRWVSQHLGSCRFGHRVESIGWHPGHRVFVVDYTREDTTGDGVLAGRAHARNLAFGIGTEPVVPQALRPLVGDPAVTVLHSADYLARRAELLASPRVTVVGSGQSGAEVFLDLLRHRPLGREGLRWISRSPGFAPMEYSRLGLEHFTPDYTRFFAALPEPARDRLLPTQWQLYKGISAQTIGDIHHELYRRSVPGGWPDVMLRPATTVRAARVVPGAIELELGHTQQDGTLTEHTDAVVSATGYRERPLLPLLGDLADSLVTDDAGRPLVDHAYRLVSDGSVTGSIFVQNAERHTHGVSAPDLGLAAWRSAVIVNTLAGRSVYPLPARTAFTTFGFGPPARETIATTLRSHHVGQENG
ncbi:MAG TPA: SidA/IucD/PvdA family monooxygenase [Pseudonocardiaceae bacterium]|nr:SidA/IucD/PvdA family monooxygenase [Pseudonocardiaceae bacterium]